MQPVRQPARAPAAVRPATVAPRKAPTPAPVSAVAALQRRIGNGGMRALVEGQRAARPPVRGGQAAKGAGVGDRGEGRVPRRKPGRAHPVHPAPGADEAGAEKAKAAVPEAGEAGGGAEKGAAATAVQLHMPEPPTRPSPASLHRLKAVQTRAGGKAAAHAALPGGGAQVGDARKAVTPPTAEAEAAAQAALIAQVQAAPSPEIVKLCERIREVIRNKRPPDEDALMEAKPDEAATDAGNQLNATVESESKKVQSNYGAMNTPPAAAAPPKAPGIPPQPSVAGTPAVNAQAATPDAVPPSAVSLEKDAAESKAKAQGAGMDSAPAQLVQSGPVAEARAAQGELDQVAREGPAEVLAKQKQALGRAEAGMASLGAQALAALTASRGTAAGANETRQHSMVGSEESMRAKAGADAKQAFDEARAAVDGLLKDLPEKAMDEWNSAKDVLVTKFKADLAEVKERVDKRHSGVGGFVVGLWDAVTGLPGWAEKAYTKAESNFANGVIEKLTSISTKVNAVIAACDLIIKGAREKIAKIFSALPESLRGWADKEQANFNGQLDKLHDQAIAARDSFNKGLKESASAAVDEVRAEIADLRKKAGGLVGRIAAAVGRFLDDPVKFIIEGLLELLGIPPAAFWAVVAKIKKVVKDIAADPLSFADNLLKGLAKGFGQFFDNFGEHMIRGFLSWLFGDLKGVQVPKDVSLKSVITFFLQLMGITWPNIRKILVDKIGAKNVALIEKAYSLISLLMEKGPEGIYEMIKEKLNPQSIVDQVVEMAVEYMVTAIAKQVAVRLLLLFNPVGAIVQALEAIYRVLKWIFQNAAKIFSLVETVVNGIADIVAGNVGGFATAVETALEKLIAPVIGFIADYFSLGDLPSVVAAKIKAMQKWILGHIESAVGWIIEKGKALLAAVGIGKKKDAGKKGGTVVGETVAIEAPDETHSLYIEVQGEDAEVMVASANPMSVRKKLTSFEKRIGEIEKSKQKTVLGTIEEARGLATKTKKKADELVRAPADPAKKPAAGGQDVASDEHKLADLLKALYVAYGEHGMAPIAGTYIKLRGMSKERPDQEVHHVPPKALLSWMKDVAETVVKSQKNTILISKAEFKWVKSLATTKDHVFNPGDTLSSISIHKETHIKKGADPSAALWRIHWGAETAKAVFKRLKSKTVVINVDGVPTKFNMVFIKRKAFADLGPEDKKALKEMEDEAGESFDGPEAGKALDAAGVSISTQFFKSELWAALDEAEDHAKLDLDNLAHKLGLAARGAAAMAQAAVEAALSMSKRDGSAEEKAAATADLRQQASQIWNEVEGVDELHMI